MARVVADITKDMLWEEAQLDSKPPAAMAHYKLSIGALNVLQTALEGHLTDRFADMNALASHAKRVTVQPVDGHLLKRLRRE